MTGVLSALLSGVPSLAAAREAGSLGMSIGQFDANRRQAPAGELGVQVSPPWRVGNLRPVLGAMATTGGGRFGFLGVAATMPVGGPLRARLSFAPGLYRRGEGKDLGSPLEFRTGLELAWQRRGGATLGGELYHLSNAGLGTRNPGSETLAVTFSFAVWRRPGSAAPPRSAAVPPGPRGR